MIHRRQRYTEDAAFFTKQSCTLAVGQTCGLAVSISTFRDDDPDVTGIAVGSDEGSLRAAGIRACGDRSIYQDGRAKTEGVRHQAAFYQGVNVHTCNTFRAASPCTLQQPILIAVHGGTPEILAGAVAGLTISDYGVVQVRGRVASVHSEDGIQSAGCMGCGFVAAVVFTIGAGGTEPSVVGELELGNVAPGILIPFLGDGDIASGIAVGFRIA